jgi:predicted Zn finger-like uncharacterized protein
METHCTKCGAKFRLDEKQIGEHMKVQFRCTQCGGVTVVDISHRADRTRSVSPLPSFARSDPPPEIKAELLKEPPGLGLPEHEEITVKVVAGLSNGLVHKLARPRLIFGRTGGGADLEIDDPEVSRWHCAIEVKEGTVWLRDLESTNGTYFDEERTRAALLTNGAQFRIGSTVIEIGIKRKPVL